MTWVPVPDGVYPATHLAAVLRGHVDQAAELIRIQQALYAAIDGLKGARSHVDRDVEGALAEVREVIATDRPEPDNGCRIDGDLVGMAVLSACPAWMADGAAHELVDRALATLAGYEGVTVLHGEGSLPWTPPEKEADRGQSED